MKKIFLLIGLMAMLIFFGGECKADEVDEYFTRIVINYSNAFEIAIKTIGSCMDEGFSVKGVIYYPDGKSVTLIMKYKDLQLMFGFHDNSNVVKASLATLFFEDGKWTGRTSDKLEQLRLKHLREIKDYFEGRDKK